MEHIILGVILLIHAGLLVAGLRMLVIVTREVGIISVQATATLEAVSKLLKDKS